MVRVMGLEPTRPIEHKHLKLACLPIPAHSQMSPSTGDLFIISFCSILSRAFFEFFQILEKLWLFAATVALYLVLPRLSTPFFRKFPLRPKNAAARWPPHSGST